MSELRLRIKKQRDPRLAEIFRPGKWVQTPKAMLKALISNTGRFSKNEIQVLLSISLKTWGFQKYSDRISRTQISAMTGIDVSAISRALTQLRARQVIVQCKDYSWKKMRPYEWRIEDDTAKWLARKSQRDKKSLGMIYPQNPVTNSPKRQGTIHVTTIDSQKKEISIERPHKAEIIIKENNYVPIENRKARY